MGLQKAAFKNGLKQDLINILSNPSTSGNIQEVAEALAEAITNRTDTFVKTGTVSGATSDGAAVTNLPIT